jgi:hypothetical protein
MIAAIFILLFRLANFLNLKMEAKSSSETSVDFQRATRRYVPEHRNFQNLGLFTGLSSVKTES